MIERVYPSQRKKKKDCENGQRRQREVIPKVLGEKKRSYCCPKVVRSTIVIKKIVRNVERGKGGGVCG